MRILCIVCQRADNSSPQLYILFGRETMAGWEQRASSARVCISMNGHGHITGYVQCCCGTISGMEQTLYLVRHGHTMGTQSELMYGNTELPVTYEGLSEVADFAAQGIYPDPDGAAVYTSGMVRALQTLAVMYGADPDSAFVSMEEIYPERTDNVKSAAAKMDSLCRVPHMTEPLLREINLGSFEMKTVSEVLSDERGKAWLEGRLQDPQFEGGDSMSGFARRVEQGIRNVIDESASRGEDTMIVVIHGGVIAHILDSFFPGTYSNLWDWTPQPGTGYEIRLIDGAPQSWKPVGKAGFRVVPMK